MEAYRRSTTGTPDDMELGGAAGVGAGGFSSLATPALGIFSPGNSAKFSFGNNGSFGKLIQTPTVTSLAYTVGITPVTGGLPFGFSNTPMSDISMNMSPSIFSPCQNEFVSFCQSSAMKQLQTPQGPSRSSNPSTTPPITSPSALEMLATASSVQKSVGPTGSSSHSPLCIVEGGDGTCLSMDVHVDSFNTDPNTESSEVGSELKMSTENETNNGSSSPESSIVFASPSSDGVNNAVSSSIVSERADEHHCELDGGGELSDLNISIISSTSTNADLSPNNSDYDDLESSLDISGLADGGDAIAIDNENENDISNVSNVSTENGSDIGDSPIPHNTLNRSLDTSVGVSTRRQVAATTATASTVIQKKRYTTRSKNSFTQQGTQQGTKGQQPTSSSSGDRAKNDESVSSPQQKQPRRGEALQENNALHALLSLKMDPLVQ